MTLYDEYSPFPSLLCPFCLSEIADWVGVDVGQLRTFHSGDTIAGGTHIIEGFCEGCGTQFQAELKLDAHQRWVGTALTAAERVHGAPLGNGYFLWRNRKQLCAVAPTDPQSESECVPANVVAVGREQDLIVVVRDSATSEIAALDTQRRARTSVPASLPTLHPVEHFEHTLWDAGKAKP